MERRAPSIYDTIDFKR